MYIQWRDMLGAVHFKSFNHDDNFYHHIVWGRIIHRDKSNDDIHFIWSCQLYSVSRYSTLTEVTYFDHNNEWRLETIGGLSKCELVIYVFFGSMKINVPVLYYYTKENRRSSDFRHHFKNRLIYTISLNIIILNQLSVFFLRFSILKVDNLNTYYCWFSIQSIVQIFSFFE